MSQELPVGTQVAGYRVDGVVGRGGMGIVYRAICPERVEPVALKVMDSGSGRDRAFVTEEARLAAAVVHRHLLPVYETGLHEGRPYVAMRLESADLGAVLRAKGRLGLSQAVDIASQVASALDAVHAHGLVHRDVKPQNVLLGEEDGEQRAYVADFGVARAAYAGGGVLTRDMVGTVGYASPEQIRGEPIDRRSDVYALGCLLYECVTGRPPFVRPSSLATQWAHLYEEPPSATMLVPELPPGLDAVISRALAKNPDDRFESAGAFAWAAREAVRTRSRLGARAEPETPDRAFLTPTSTFLGREQELYHADRALQKARVLTVAGPGGAGKTRFALELARRAREARSGDYDDGVFTCFLAPLREPTLVLTTIAQALSLREAPGRSALETLSVRLRDKRILVVLDNLEHLMPSVIELSRLLAECPGLTVLVTSRERLRIAHETLYELPPLRPHESVDLFCERAHVEPSPAIEDLCQRLEGLPLAIELAAARSSVLSPEQLRSRLSSRLDLLEASKEVDPRQRTLRSTIQWSYDLLDPNEQTVFARLSVFAGGCSLDAAQEVCDADLEGLESLLEKSLLRRSGTEARPRFSMLDTIREFAADALDRSGDAEAVRRRFIAQFTQLAKQLEPTRYGQSTAEERAQFQEDAANFRLAVSFAIDGEDASAALRLVGFLGDHWYDSSGRRESLGLAQAALDVPGGGARERAHALHKASRLAAEVGDTAEYRRLASAVADAFAELDEARGLWQVIQERAHCESAFGDHDQAISYGEHAIEIARKAGARPLEMIATQTLAGALVAREYAQDRPDTEVLRHCRALYENALAWARAEGNIVEKCGIATNLAWMLCLTGDHKAALDSALYALELAVREKVVSWPTVIHSVFHCGIAASHLGLEPAGTHLTASASTAFEREGILAHPSQERCRARAETIARAALGDEAYERGVREGERLALDEVLELALQLTRARSTGEAPGFRLDRETRLASYQP